MKSNQSAVLADHTGTAGEDPRGVPRGGVRRATDPPYVSLREAAQALGISYEAAKKRQQRGRLPANGPYHRRPRWRVWRSWLEERTSELAVLAEHTSVKRRRLVSAEPCRRYLKWLEGQGMTRIAMARAAGVSPATVSQILSPERARTSTATARRLMAVRADQWPPGVRAPASEARAGVQKLRDCGVSPATIKRVLGITADQLDRREMVSPQTRERVRIGLAMAQSQGLLAREEASYHV
jgi:transcriptional regulator with XRE-family HTH domain